MLCDIAGDVRGARSPTCAAATTITRGDQHRVQRRSTMMAMRSNHLSLLIGLSFLVGCGAYATGAGGETRAKYSGGVPLVFTNATPQTMCELHMSFEVDPKFGDNWLPRGGLPSGQSIELKVQPGKYKATWNTCKKASDKLYYAGTLIGETAFFVNDQTQLFTYVADNVAPTKRAPPRDFFTMVKFSGQPICG